MLETSLNLWLLWKWRHCVLCIERTYLLLSIFSYVTYICCFIFIYFPACAFLNLSFETTKQFSTIRFLFSWRSFLLLFPATKNVHTRPCVLQIEFVPVPQNAFKIIPAQQCTPYTISLWFCYSYTRRGMGRLNQDSWKQYKPLDCKAWISTSNENVSDFTSFPSKRRNKFAWQQFTHTHTNTYTHTLKL